MFTGLITDVGRLRAREPLEKGVRFEIETGFPMDEVAIGASIACSGACLTVVEKGADWFAVDVSAETLDKTTLDGWQAGRRINLERSLRLGDELGGHIVSGHVDGVAEIVDRGADGEATRFTIRPPAELAHFVASKGSVALDGVSLTVNELSDGGFGVCIIPHTAAGTTFGDLRPGDRVNLEIDMLARYVARLLEKDS
ncbi:MAG: riboflavin synthase [Alphaproteobacteria bacterium]|nr:riboflavin synthase [Alphaproteobacteria bacterium]